MAQEDSFEIVSRAELLRAHVFSVARFDVVHNDEIFERTIAEHPGAVFVVAVDDAGRVGMIRQWRVARRGYQWELVAGTRDVAGEAELLTAQRELREELGIEAAEWRPLTWFYTSPGWTDQRNSIFVATSLTVTERDTAGPEEGASSIGWLTRREIRDLIFDGGLDAVSAAALALVLTDDLSD
jgi:ADP-ribose pyrophosphatase